MFQFLGFLRFQYLEFSRYSFSLLNSAEHEILNAHKCKKNHHFSGSDKPRMLVFLLINVKMPTIVGILTFMRGKLSCSAELSMTFYDFGASLSICIMHFFKILSFFA